jgi:uncharacterized membrane protein YhaH (DUF805 family)
MEWMMLPLKRYADYSGRSRRKEFWMFPVTVLIAFVAIMLVSSVIGGLFTLLGLYSLAALGRLVLYGVFLGATLVVGIPLAVRRLHDTDKPGWALLIALVPFVGAIVLALFYFYDGTPGPNRFGDDPKAAERAVA